MTGYIIEGMTEVKARLIMIIAKDKKAEDTMNKIFKEVLLEGKRVLGKTLSGTIINIVMTLRLTPYSYK